MKTIQVQYRQFEQILSIQYHTNMYHMYLFYNKEFLSIKPFFVQLGLFRNSCNVLNLPIRYSHTERTGGTFPMALTAMTAKDWKESLDFSTQEVPEFEII